MFSKTGSAVLRGFCICFQPPGRTGSEEDRAPESSLRQEGSCVRKGAGCAGIGTAAALGLLGFEPISTVDWQFLGA